jgi:hypothetical protein
MSVTYDVWLTFNANKGLLKSHSICRNIIFDSVNLTVACDDYSTFKNSKTIILLYSMMMNGPVYEAVFDDEWIGECSTIQG